MNRGWTIALAALAAVYAGSCAESAGPEHPRIVRAPASAPATDAGTRTIGPAYADAEFVEGPRNRNPFRNLLEGAFVETIPQPPGPMPDTALEQAELIAVISGISRPRAMLRDPLGMGHVVERGQFVGRPTQVRIDTTEVLLQWRVARIRPDEIVFTRADPTTTGPPRTHVMTLTPHAS